MFQAVDRSTTLLFEGVDEHSFTDPLRRENVMSLILRWQVRTKSEYSKTEMISSAIALSATPTTCAARPI